MTAGRQGLDEVDGFSVREANDGFLVAGGASFVGAALAADFAVVVCGADFDDLLVENGFDGLLDLKFVGGTIDFENNLVVLLLEQGGLFAEADVLNDLVDVFHGRRCSGKLGCALCEDGDGVADEDDDPREEQLLNVEIGRSDKLCPCNVACSKLGGVVEVTDEENLAVCVSDVL